MAAEWPDRLQEQLRRRVADQSDLIMQLEGELMPSGLLEARDEPSKIAGQLRARIIAPCCGRRPRACAGTLAAQLLEKGCGIRQFGSMDEPQKRHFRGLPRIRRGIDVLQPLQKHLPQSVDRSPSKRPSEGLRALALLRGLESADTRTGLGARCGVKALH